MIIPITECGFAHSPSVLVYAKGPSTRVTAGVQGLPYALGEFIGTITPTQMSDCKTKQFTVFWTLPGTYQFVLVQPTSPGWRIMRFPLAVGR